MSRLSRLVGPVVLSLSVAITVSACGSGSTTDSASNVVKRAPNSKLCRSADAYLWYRGYAAGKYGGPPNNGEAVQPLFDTILTELHDVEAALPASEKHDAKAVNAMLTYEKNQYEKYDWGPTEAQYRKIVKHVAHVHGQDHRFAGWLTASCSVKGKPWPTKPPLAGQITSLG